MDRRSMFRYLLAGAIAVPLALKAAGQEDHHEDRDEHEQRYYDRDRRDWHEWNEHEERAYRRYLEERREQYRAWRERNEEQQRAYWRWRHQHPDSALWPK